MKYRTKISLIFGDNPSISTIQRSLKLYNVQFYNKYANLVNKFIFAYNKEDAINIIIRRYSSVNPINKEDLFCEKVNIKEGLTFNP